MRSIRRLIFGLVAAIVIRVTTFYWGDFFTRKKLEYKIDIMRFPYEIYSLNWYLAVIAFRNSRRSKLANVPIKYYCENPKVKPVGTPMEIVKNKPDLHLKSIDIARYFEYAIRAEQEVIAGIERLSVSEYISRLKSGIHFSIEALDSGRYSIHMIIYCSVRSAEVFCKDNLNVISPRPQHLFIKARKFLETN